MLKGRDKVGAPNSQQQATTIRLNSDLIRHLSHRDLWQHLIDQRVPRMGLTVGLLLET